ncbi:uncharacterized protein LOC144612766 [Panthera onca]
MGQGVGEELEEEEEKEEEEEEEKEEKKEERGEVGEKEAWILRWCHDSVKHWGAGPTPPGRGQEETDKCAAAGVSRVPGLRNRPYNLSPRQGAAQLLRPALQPGFLDQR